MAHMTNLTWARWKLVGPKSNSFQDGQELPAPVVYTRNRTDQVTIVEGDGQDGKLNTASGSGSLMEATR